MKSIGPYIRDNVLPKGMSVSEAARRLGVPRSTLSNLLNGIAKLSREMALKLEREFGADADKLMRRQAQIEAAAREAADRELEKAGRVLKASVLRHRAKNLLGIPE